MAAQIDYRTKIDTIFAPFAVRKAIPAPTAAALKVHTLPAESEPVEQKISVESLKAAIKTLALKVNGDDVDSKNDTASRIKEFVDLAYENRAEFESFYKNDKKVSEDANGYAMIFAQNFVEFIEERRRELINDISKEIEESTREVNLFNDFVKEFQDILQFDAFFMKAKTSLDDLKLIARNKELLIETIKIGKSTDDDGSVNRLVYENKYKEEGAKQSSFKLFDNDTWSNQEILERAIAQMKAFEQDKVKKKEAAAIKLQAAFRGYTVRKKNLSNSTDYSAKEHEDNHVKAVTKLQAAWRGRQVRKNLTKELEDNRVKAVTKLQAAWRGRQVRKNIVKELEDNNKAATKLQALWRGYQVRKNGELALKKQQEQEAKKAEEEAKKAEEEAKNKEQADKIKDELKKEYSSSDSDLSGRFDRVAYVEKMLKLRGLKEGDEGYDEVKNELEKSPTFNIPGYDKEPLENSVHKNDNIQFSKSGIEYASFNVNQGGEGRFHDFLENYRNQKNDFEGFVVVKMDGEILRPKVIQGKIQTRQKIVVEKDKDGNEIGTKTINEVVTESEVPPSYIIHKDGNTTIQTFVKSDVVDRFLNLSKDEYAKVVDKITDDSCKALKEQDEKFAKQNPEFKALEGEEREAEIKRMVKEAIYDRSQELIGVEIQNHKAKNEIYLKNSLNPVEAALGPKNKGKNAKQRLAIKQLNSVVDPYGVDGASIVKDGNIVKIAFHQSEEAKVINDTVYVAVYSDLMQRAQVATYDGEEISYYKDGVLQAAKRCYKGEIVFDENTLVHRDANGEIKPVVIDRVGYFGSKFKEHSKALRNAPTLEEHFLGSSSARNARNKYKNMTFQATSMMGLQMSSAILLPGDKKKTHSGKVPKVAMFFQDDEQIQVERKLPDSIKELKSNGGFKINSSQLIQIPDFSTLVFDKKGNSSDERIAILESAKHELRLKVAGFVQESDLLAMQRIINIKKSDILNKRSSSGDLKIIEKYEKFNQSYGISEFLFNYLKENGIKYSNAPTIGTVILEDGIFDNEGRKLDEKALKVKYGKEFINELKQTKAGAQVQDEKAILEEQFFNAVRNGNVEMVGKMIEIYNKKLEEVYKEAKESSNKFLTPTEARQQRAQDISSMLNDYCFNIHAKDGIYKQDALQIAIESSQEKMMELLLENGFDPANRSAKKPSKGKVKSGMNAYELYMDKYDVKKDKIPEKLKVDGRGSAKDPIVKFLMDKELELSKEADKVESNQITLMPPKLKDNGSAEYHRHGIGGDAFDKNKFILYVDVDKKVIQKYFDDKNAFFRNKVAVRVNFNKNGEAEIDQSSIQLFNEKTGAIVDPDFKENASKAEFVSLMNDKIKEQFKINREIIDAAEKEFLENVAKGNSGEIHSSIISCPEFNIDVKNEKGKTAIDLIIENTSINEDILIKIVNAGANINLNHRNALVNKSLKSQTKEAIINNLNEKNGVYKTSIEIGRKENGEVIFATGYYCENDGLAYEEGSFEGKNVTAKTFIIPKNPDFYVVKDGSSEKVEGSQEISDMIKSFEGKTEFQSQDFSSKTPATTIEVLQVENLFASSKKSMSVAI